MFRPWPVDVRKQKNRIDIALPSLHPLAVFVLELAAAGRRGQARDGEVLEHLHAARFEDLLRDVLQDARRVPEHAADAIAVDDTGGATAGVALDLGIGHLLHAGRLDRLAVQVVRLARELQEDRVVWQDLVQLLARERRVGSSRELIGRPAAEREDPLARALAAWPAPGASPSPACAYDAVEAVFERPVRALFLEVRVVVDEPRHQRAAAQIDPPGVGTGQRVDLLVGARPRRIRSPRMATACAIENFSSTVMTLPSVSTMSARACRAGALGGSGLLRAREAETRQ